MEWLARNVSLARGGKFVYPDLEDEDEEATTEVM